MKVYFDQMSNFYSLTQKNAINFLEDSIEHFENNNWDTNNSPYVEDYGIYISKLPKGFNYADVHLTHLYDITDYPSEARNEWNVALDEVKSL